MHQRGLYRFGPYRADLEQRVLLRDGEIVRLTPKAFDLLAVLVQHHGDVVAKETILKEVWPDTFVEEGNLTYNVNVLRNALGDDGHESQRYIETVRARGYRFIAKVALVTDGQDSETQNGALQVGDSANTAGLAAHARDLVKQARPLSTYDESEALGPRREQDLEQPAARHGRMAELLSNASTKRAVLLAAGLTAVALAIADVILVRPQGIQGSRDAILIGLAGFALYSYHKLRSAPAGIAEAPPRGAAFRGLLPFDPSDADRFYGRDIDTAALFDLVTHSEFRFGVLYGDSGAGKSSLIRAGLIPRLTNTGYAAVYCRSYKDPIRELVVQCRFETSVTLRKEENAADYLRRVAQRSAGGLVVVFDQFEEFFINFKTRQSRAAFVSLISECFHTTDLPVRFVFGIRSDFLHLIASAFDAQIPETLSTARRYHLQHFDEEQAAQVIDESVRGANWRFEEGLSQKVARDLAVNDKVLPSELQIVGQQLQSKRLFTYKDYQRSGRKEQLVHSYLEDVIKLTGDQETAHLVLRCLVSDENTRLSVTIPEMVKCSQRTQRVIERILNSFVQTRLVRVTQDEQPWRYELMHEYLIELINQITGRVTDSRQRANRLFRQYLANYVFDKGTRIPLRNLWIINRFSDIPQGNRERQLLKKSLRAGLIKSAAAAIALAITVLASVAWFSVREEWELAQLREGHTAAVHRAVFSPDGRLLVSAGEDGRVIVWDFARRLQLASLTEHSGWVNALAFSPDGKLFATGGYDSRVILWDAATMRVLRALDQPGIVGGLEFSPDSRLLASSSKQMPPTLWDVKEWTKAREFSGNGAEFFGFSFSPDGRIFTDGNRFWELESGRQMYPSLDSTWGVTWSAFFAGGTRLVGVDCFGYAKFIDVASGKVIAAHKAHQDNGRAAAASPDGRLVATGADNIVLWDGATLRKIARLEHPAVVWSLAFSPDGRWLVSTHGDGSIMVWDPVDHERVANLSEHSGPVRAVAVSQDGRHIASASEDRSVIVWNAESGSKEAVLVGHKNRLTGVAFCGDGKTLASSDQDGVTICWDATEGRQLWTQAAPLPNQCLAASPDGQWVAVPNGVYRASDGAPAVRFNLNVPWVHPSLIWGISFSPDSSRLVYFADRYLVVWDARTWTLLTHTEFTGPEIVCLRFSPDGKTFVTGDVEGTLRLWTLEALRDVAVIGRHSARVKSVAFSPDGKEVASASDDQTVALWDAERRRLKTTIGNHAAPVLSVAFSPDGHQVVCGTHDAKVRIYTRYETLWGHKVTWR